MHTLALLEMRKHLIEDHGWTPEQANAEYSWDGHDADPRADHSHEQPVEDKPMPTHVLYRHRRHWILDHGWHPDDANAESTMDKHDAEHAASQLDHTH